MDKKLILSKSIMFIFIVGFVVGFKSIFGADNTLIGVTTITATLMFLERDLTLSPIKNTLRLVGLNLLIGLATIIASYNMFIAIPVNFITVFIISYSLCYSLKNPMYLPFSLQFLFLLATPVSSDRIFIRLLALICGALIIMLVQMIANRNRIHKSGNKILSQVCSDILVKLNNIKDNNKSEDINTNIKRSLYLFRKMVYDQREADFYLTEEGRIKLNLSVALENIDILLDKVQDYSKNNSLLYNLELFISEVKDILDNDNNEVNLSNNMKQLLIHCENKNITDLFTLQLLESIIFLCDTIGELRTLTKENYDTIKKPGKIPENFAKRSLKSIFLNRKSLKFCYAMRISIAIAIGAFIMDYFDFSEGRWIIFTIFSLVTPIYESSTTKTKDRIIATIIGSIILVILFGIFKDTTSRTLILILAGYIGSYTNEYKYNMICVTVSAIGAAAIVGNTQVVTLNRIIFVIVGAVLAILANKFLFPYKLKDSNEELKEIYDNTIQQMFEELYNASKGIKETNSIKNLLIRTSLIEEKARLNNQISNSKLDEEIIKERRILVANIYKLYIWIVRENISIQDLKIIVQDIKILVEYDNSPIEFRLETIKEHIKETNDLKSRITFSNICVILKELQEINELKFKAQI